MIILRKAGTNTPGTWFDFEMLGDTVRLKIRPLTIGIIDTINKKHKGIKDDATRNEKINQDLIDYLIEDWQGFGDEDGNPLPLTPENKRAIMGIIPPEGEQSLSGFVFDKAKELAVVRQEAVEKN